MNIKTLLRIAHWTRRFARYRNPVRFKFSRWALNLLYPAKKRERSECVVVEYDQGLVHADTASGLEYGLLFFGYHEPEIVRLIKSVVKPGAVCLDIGANVGAHTLVMAFAAGPRGRVIAVEPHPELSARLMENLALNNLKHVTLVRAAVSEEDGLAAFYTYDNGAFNRGMSSLKPSEQSQRPIQVRTISGRTLQEESNLTACDLIKIDVEGYEMVVLRELADLIGRTRPYLIFEYRRPHWERCGQAIEEAIELLEKLNYKMYCVKHEIIRPTGRAIPDRCDLFCIPMPHAKVDFGMGMA